jgi:hypothetical protein
MVERQLPKLHTGGFDSPHPLSIANRLEMRRTGNMSKDVLPTALECPRNRFLFPDRGRGEADFRESDKSI